MGLPEAMRPGVRPRLVAAVMRQYPFYSGCGTVASLPAVRRAAGRCDGLAWARIAGGQRLLVKLGDYEGWSIYFTGDWDRKITWLCRRLVEPGDTVLDIGTNLGLVTMTLAQCVGAGGCVHAFEPNLEMVRLVGKSLEANEAEQVTLHPFALGDEEAELPLHVPAHHAGLGSLAAGHARPGADQVTVRVRPLSLVAEEAGIGKARLVKIDVEGFEPQVLRGAEQWFDQTPPDAVLFEYDPTGRPLGESPVVEWLTYRGYVMLAIPRCMLRMWLKRADITQADDPHCHDYLAVREGDALERVCKRVRVVD